ncbi:MAG: hypothetical protein WBM69_21015 [Desulfobacterales bacterium]
MEKPVKALIKQIDSKLDSQIFFAANIDPHNECQVLSTALNIISTAWSIQHLLVDLRRLLKDEDSDDGNKEIDPIPF